MDLADFRALIDVHLMGAVYCSHAAWPTMRTKNFGRIVMTSSAAGLYGNHGHTNYGAAKMSLIGFMNALKEEGRKHNITVHAIAPMALTRMTEAITAPKIAQLLKPEFVTAAVAWFCAPENEETGHIIEAGAGYYAKVEMMTDDPGKRTDDKDAANKSIGKMAELLAVALPELERCLPDWNAVKGGKPAPAESPVASK